MGLESAVCGVIGRPVKRSKGSSRDAPTGRNMVRPVSEEPSTEEAAFDETGLSKEEIKKRRRMLKNRQSASLSRKRKKEYLESLEDQIKGLSDNNEALRRALAQQSEECKALRAQLQHSGPLPPLGHGSADPSRVVQLERENAELRQQLGSQSRAGRSIAFRPGTVGTVLMAGLVCFALFTNPAAPAARISGSVALSHQGPHFGRTLKALSLPAVQTTDPMKLLESSTSISRRRKKHNRLSAPQHLAPVGAPVENAPGGNQIDRWLAAHEARLVSQLNDTQPPLRVPGTEVARRDPNADARAQQVPTFKIEGGYATMMNTVQRRTDTSYVFCSEVSIMSAMAASGLANPKVSFIMPVERKSTQTGANGTGDVDSLLQVNCDVRNTELLRSNTNTNASVG